ncbi:mitochondrial splicing system protein [Rhodosporidiobolus nylandii]
MRARLASSSRSSFPFPSARTPTIFAPATGKGKSAISILRISGDDALEVWRRMTLPARAKGGGNEEGTAASEGRKTRRDPPERRAVLRSIVHPETREQLDEAVVLYFPASSALTAQPTLELHLHGSPALMQLLLRVLPTLTPESGGKFRIAEPGEFTRLAFEAGKMDLTEVEGIRDLVDAETEQQRRLAARQASGHIRQAYDSMRATCIEAMALCEALIDFGEDAEISEGVFEQARDKVLALRKLIMKHLDDGRRGEIIRQGIQLAIIGPPNAGKSSLLNWLAQREAAIVTSVPGTTRDVVELSLDFHGYPIQVADTAGLRKTGDEVERIGIKRAVERAQAADLKLCVLSLPSLFPSSLSASPSPYIDSQTLSLIDSNTLIILNKSDTSRPSAEQLDALREMLRREGRNWMGEKEETGGFVCVSVKQGEGLGPLAERVKGELKERFDLSDDLEETPIVTHERHRRHLEVCLQSLESFLEMEAEDVVDAGEELRYASQSLGQITGAVDVEEVLGEIFRGFCIGK